MPMVLHFAPYSTADIIDIIKARLIQSDANLMDHSAIELCARKISAVGDLRKALDICNLAIDLANKDSSPETTPSGIKLQHVLSAINKLFASQNALRIKSLNLHSKIIMTSFYREKTKRMDESCGKAKSSKGGDVLFGALHDGYTNLCNESRLSSCVSRSEFFDLVNNLQSNGIITVSKGKEERNRKVSTQMSIEDIFQGIEDVPILNTLCRN